MPFWLAARTNKRADLVQFQIRPWIHAGAFLSPCVWGHVVYPHLGAWKGVRENAERRLLLQIYVKYYTEGFLKELCFIYAKQCRCAPLSSLGNGF
jgi:hypothetical protein